MTFTALPERQKDVLPKTEYVDEREFCRLLVSRRQLERDDRIGEPPAALLDSAKRIRYLVSAPGCGSRPASG